ncbi:serine transporter [Corynebacterium diphtheriae]|nr:serine transporter [Corynebacterium diphtheriae]
MSERSTDPVPFSNEHQRVSADEFELENLTVADKREIRRTRRAPAPDGSAWSWAITLFGTAVGAGILFLPIDAGSFGFWPLLLATILVGPMVFFSHRMYSRIVSASPVKGLDVLQVITSLAGRKRGLATALMHWLAIYPIVLIYGISVTNTMDSFIVNQMGGPHVDRWLLATICVGVMTGAYTLGKKATLWFANLLVYPLIVALAAVSLYLIPYWDLDSFMAYKSDDGDVAGTEKEVSKIELITCTLLVGFTMFFVWSCTLALGSDGMAVVREENIPVLSYFANTTNAPFMAVVTPVVALCAIASSYFGHMLGTEEGTQYLLRAVAPKASEKWNPRVVRAGIYLFVFLSTVAVAIFNPSILSLISVVGGIFITLLVYIVPMLLFRHATAFRHYAKQPEAIFVFGLGIVIICVTVWQMVA